MFTAAAGDLFSLNDLYTATTPTGSNVAGYKVALRSDQAAPNGGQLLLGDKDVTGQLSFTADEFSRLHFKAGPNGTQQDLVVVAQLGNRQSDGKLSNVTDSPAVQITVNVTGTRSINATGALLTRAAGTDANFVNTAQEASIFTGFGKARPSLATVGNFTAADSDLFSLGDLYTATAPAGGSIAGYKVALRGDPGAPNAGQLLLGDKDVTGQLSFTADEFSRLHFKAGPNGTQQDVVVVAQTGTRLADGTLSNVVDSAAVQATASVTGTRSINAVNALLTKPTDADANFVNTAQEASIFTGFGKARPGLTSVGNFTAADSDLFSLGDLYTATAPAGSTVAGYKVALRGDPGAPNAGQLLLGDKDVTGQLSFTADEFSRLHFKAGPGGTQQDLVVVAQLGSRGANGKLSNVVDSPAVQITASVTGTRSINAVGALLTRPTRSDDDFVNTAQEASIFTGFGKTRPSLATVGNFTAADGDLFSMSDLYTATAPAGSSIAGYKVAVRRDPGALNDGQLLLGDKDVTGQLSFTADEFSRLHFKAGTGTQQDLVVVAQLGSRGADGRLTNVIDSPAVQITASATGTRSINASGALLTRATGDDANFVNTAQEASIFTGFGQARPTLKTVGNLSAAEGDLFSLGDLYTATAPTGSSIANYKVALRNQGSSGNGQLLLGDKDVTGRLSFTADEFSRLHFKAGPSGTRQDLVVVAQLGSRRADGTLSNVVDSPAVQITANVTGTRSLNGIGALLTRATGDDANFVNTAQEASIFTGFGKARPSLSTVGTPYDPHMAESLLASLVGRFQSTQAAASSTALATFLQLSPHYADAIATSQTAGSTKTGSAQDAASWLLSPSDLEGYQTAGAGLGLQKFAVAAYQASQKAS